MKEDNTRDCLTAAGRQQPPLLPKLWGRKSHLKCHRKAQRWPKGLLALLLPQPTSPALLGPRKSLRSRPGEEHCHYHGV